MAGVAFGHSGFGFDSGFELRISSFRRVARRPRPPGRPAGPRFKALGPARLDLGLWTLD